MEMPTKSRRYRDLRRLFALICATSLVGALGFGRTYWRTRPSSSERYVTAGVRRADLFPKLTASGRVESSNRTVIECQLENIAVGVRGQRLEAGGASVLLSVIPEGSSVKRGDVLAVLDSSDYEELLRVQRITLERASADKLQAELDVEIAKLAVQEFLEGTMRETTEDFEGRISPGAFRPGAFDRPAQLVPPHERQRLPARGQRHRGRFPEGTDGAGTDATRVGLRPVQEVHGPEDHQAFGRGRERGRGDLELSGTPVQAPARPARLAGKQVENCTIRAPHDGFVIYANNSNREIYIEPGMPVRQRQQLFYLPDLNRDGSGGDAARVDRRSGHSGHAGQRSGRRDRKPSDRGHVTSIAPMSTFNWRSDVRYFEGIVKLENIPGGLKPGMSAEVEIAMPRRGNVLAVPSEAIMIENGHDVCFVVHDEGLERREVKLGKITSRPCRSDPRTGGRRAGGPQSIARRHGSGNHFHGALT